MRGFWRLSHQARPYWYVDAKWVCALLLIFSLGITLPFVAIYRLTERTPATQLMTYALAGLSSPDGIDSPNGIVQLRNDALQSGGRALAIGGTSISFTANELQSLTPRDLRLRVFQGFANHFYAQGAQQFAESQGFGQTAVTKFTQAAATFNLLTRSEHFRIALLLVGLGLIDCILFAGLIFFSHQFGRFVSPAIVLLISGLPGLPLGVIASQHATISGTATLATAVNAFSMLGDIATYTLPLISPSFAGSYLFVLYTGIFLLVIAAVGRSAYKLLKQPAKEKQLPDTP